MMMKPRITVSEQDLEQLESLLDMLPVSAANCRSALLAELDRADIVDLSDIPHSVVTMNSTVRFEIDSPREEFCLTLTYPSETGNTPDTISVLTPIGTALLGMFVGSEIEWPRPDGKLVKVRILDVVRHPEHAGKQEIS
ncbi:nucleoside diphosphate kinase regulator [Noviherbaspirillum sp. UKPF54]|uniref:nucleoside diphosphate kinase regulator n=1 Tax=Noviherbaspirillum sp. UKPF54 TaxID=2601898 RepID=UPI0011B1B18E|nr:nucleoside diphosphate kinase regulator [Noviherbaspirillum sp. UKPF54]QDZ28320.1 nucleoside diphosphate kinase regulator [Noviherbaspirillum sp. UKPF54]